MNLNQLKKFENIINICNNIQSNEFNELLLFFYEEKCQSYFSTILNNNKNEFNSVCCEELLLKLSLEYLKKAIEYLFKQNNNNDNNNILKLLSIEYIKTYFYYYVEINFNYHDKCNFNEINGIISGPNENNEKIIKMINIYIL